MAFATPVITLGASGGKTFQDDVISPIALKVEEALPGVERNDTFSAV